MKAIFQARNIFLITSSVLLLGIVGFGQEPEIKPKDGKPSPSSTATNSIQPVVPSSNPDKTSDEPADKAIADEVLPYYDNYLKEYRLGPSDVISVEVFGQCPDYCKTGITIPPNARISYPLIGGGLMVGGKTVEQIAEEITQKLDEYIIDPKVTVTLDRAVATRYSVMGNVVSPGVRVMDRKVSVYDAVLGAGGVTRNGDRKKVAIVSVAKDGRLSHRLVNLAEIDAGRTPVVYLSPGDQVYVPGKGFSMQKVLDVLMRASTLRYMIPGVPNIPYIPGLPTIP